MWIEKEETISEIFNVMCYLNKFLFKRLKEQSETDVVSNKYPISSVLIVKILKKPGTWA